MNHYFPITNNLAASAMAAAQAIVAEHCGGRVVSTSINQAGVWSIANEIDPETPLPATAALAVAVAPVVAVILARRRNLGEFVQWVYEELGQEPLIQGVVWTLADHCGGTPRRRQRAIEKAIMRSRMILQDWAGEAAELEDLLDRHFSVQRHQMPAWRDS